MQKPLFEISDVLKIGFAKYLNSTGPLQYNQYKIVNAILACRTATLGGHIDKCNNCNHEKISYNSCRNRHCPKCQAFIRANWIENRINDILPVPYFHIVFTIPQQLNIFALRNKKSFYTIFFKAVSETLITFAKNPKYLGGEIGFFTILHTWGQNLMDHPHIHCVVPGGAMIDNAKWRHCKKNFIFPINALSLLFKSKMLDYFKESIKSCDIKLVGCLDKYKDNNLLKNLINSLYKISWVVYIKPPFASPLAVVKYLGRYTHRVAIGNNRIIDLTNNTVSFLWKDYSDNNKQKIMTLTHQEFIRRFLLHVIPSGFVRIRHYGFLSNRNRKEKLSQCMKILGLPVKDIITKVKQKTKQWYEIIIRITGKDPTICPVCASGYMKTYRELARGSPN